jgi:transcriptional regulator with XRE-family HTH domain
MKRPTRKETQTLAREAIQRSGLTKAQVARDAGLGQATLHAWIASQREPEPDSLDRLAAGLEGRAEELWRLAAGLRRAAAAARTARASDDE